MKTFIMISQGFLIGSLVTRAGLNLGDGVSWLYVLANPIFTCLYAAVCRIEENKKRV